MAASPDNPTVCVSGATGFVGAAVVEALHDSGASVRATYRSKSHLSALHGLDVRPFRADVTDRAALRRAARGSQVLFHVAGIVGSKPAGRVWEVNARGPEIAVEVAAAEGVPRVVLTSSVAGIGTSDADGPADERQIYRDGHIGLTYPNAKHEGEARALAAAARTGVELVIVCPSYTLGAPVVGGDRAQTSTRIVGNYLRGRLPAIVDSWTNVVDVEDVARGHLLAWRKGQAGERYILAGEDVRWVDLLGRIGRLAGVQHPIAVIPPGADPLARVAATLGLMSPISFEALTLMAQPHRYSSAKARRELGYEHRPLDKTLRRSVRWFMEEREAGRFSGPDLSAMRLMAQAVHAADALGAGAVGRRIAAAVRRG